MTQPLLFPVAHFDGPLPSHSITCIISSPSGYLVTGCNTGELVSWRHEKKERTRSEKFLSERDTRDKEAKVFYRPRALLVRDGAATTTSLARCLLSSSTEVLIVGSSDGSISMWSATGGRCHFSHPVLPFAATQLLPFSVRDVTYVACIGDSCEIYIIQLTTLRLVRVIRHRTRVAAATLTPDTYSQTQYLFSITILGMLHLWDIDTIIGAPSTTSARVDDRTLQATAHISDEKKRTAAAAAAALAIMSAGVDEHDWLADDVAQPVRDTKTSLQSKTLMTPAHQWSLRDIPSPPTCITVSNDGTRFALCMQRHWTTFTMRGFKPEFAPVQQLPFIRSPPLVRSTSLGAGTVIAATPPVVPSMEAVIADSHIHVHAQPYTSSYANERYMDHNNNNNNNGNGNGGDHDDDASVSSLQPLYHGGWRGIAFVDNQRVVVWSTTICDIRVYTLPDTTNPSSSVAPNGSNGLPGVGALPMRRSVTDSDDINSNHHRPSMTATTPTTSSIDAEGIPTSGTIPQWRVESKHTGRLVRRVHEWRPRLMYRLELDLARPPIIKYDMKKNGNGTAAVVSPRGAAAATGTTASEKKEEKLSVTDAEISEVPDAGLISVFVVGDTIYAGTSSGHVTQWLLPRSTTSAATITPSIITTGSPIPTPATSSPRSRASQPNIINTGSPSFFTSSPATPMATSGAHLLPIGLAPLVTDDNQHDDHVAHLLPLHVSSIQDSMPAMADHDKSNPCTTSVLAKDGHTLVLARGYRNGGITTQRLLGSVATRLELPGHRARINCLFAISGESSVLHKPLLISGSADNSIKIWDIESNRLVDTFNCPCAILSLHWHPPKPQVLPPGVTADMRKYLQFDIVAGDPGDVIFAVCEDRAVRTFSLTAMASLQVLRGHDSPVTAIYRDDWCASADYVITQTRAGTVYVFELSSGQLERSFAAQSVAAEKFLTSRGLIAASVVSAPRMSRKSGQSRRLETSAIPWITSNSNDNKDDDTLRIVPLSNTQLHLTMYVVNIHRLLNDLHQRYATLGRARRPNQSNDEMGLPDNDDDTNNDDTKRTTSTPSAAAAAAASSSSTGGPNLGGAAVRPVLKVPTAAAITPNTANAAAAASTARREEKRVVTRDAGNSRPVNGDKKDVSELGTLAGLLSIMFDWGAEASIDKVLTEALGLTAPWPAPCFCVPSDSTPAYTILLPSESFGFKPLGRWEYDSQFSARHALSLSTVCMSLLSAGDPAKQVHYSRIVSHYNVILPDVLPTYQEPDLQVLAMFALNCNEEVYTVARLLLQGVVERSTDEQRRDIVRRWGAFYSYPLTKLDMNDEKSASDDKGAASGMGPVSDQELMTALVLCFISVYEAAKRKQKAREERELKQQQITSGAPSASSTPATAAAAASSSDNGVLEVVDTGHGVRRSGAGDDGTDEPAKPLGPDDIQLPDTSSSTVAPSSSSRDAAMFSSSNKDADGGDDAPEIDRDQMEDGKEADDKVAPLPSSRVTPGISQSSGSSSSSSSSAVVSTGGRPAPISIPSTSASSSSLNDAKSRVTGEYNELDEKAAYITQTLLRMLVKFRNASQMECVKCALAADLLGKGFSMWRTHIVDVTAVIRRLHLLSMTPKQPSLAIAAHRALLEVGRVVPKYFVTCMGREAINSKASGRSRSAALIAIVQLVKRYPEALAHVLPSTVQTITRCLDPSDPALRKSLLHSATAALHMLVQKYPMVTFHQQSQRFAVGTGTAHKSVIIIYDLRTATKWRILEGHTGNLSAISFNPKGNVLVSYCCDENPPSIRAWSTGISGFFSSLLGIQGRCTKIVKLKQTRAVRSLTKRLQSTRIRWTSHKDVELVREDGSRCPFTV